MKKIPYGIADFERIVNEDYYYIDKSRYIKTVEDIASFVLLARPRRMGKSLFTSMMMSYYDIAKRDQFNELFCDLWIGHNPTTLANKFMVLYLDFSQVAYHPDDLRRNFDSYCMQRLTEFMHKYSDFFTEWDMGHVLKNQLAKEAINSLIYCVRDKSIPIYLFIDEYDNFTNTVLAARGVKAHHEITHGEGFYRDFFKCCKGTFDRIFMTGVTPVTYDDLTSGFSIATVVSLSPKLNQAIGISEPELRQMIDYYRQEGAISRPTDEVVAEMKPWYNNFCFCDECYGQEPTLYNTSSVIRYVNSLVTQGTTPRDMVDRNARTDCQKLDYLVMAEDLANRRQRIEIIEEICATGQTAGHVREEFPASQAGDEENFKSMLYYFGTVTFAGFNRLGRPILAVPNRTMGELYLNYMLQVAQSRGIDLAQSRDALREAIAMAAVDGQWEPLCDQAAMLCRQYSSVRNDIRGEHDVQGFMRGLLCLNDFFAIWPELELGHGYNDILLAPRATPRCPTRHSYLIELKSMKSADTDVQAKIDEASGQLRCYAADARLRQSGLLRGTPLTLIYMVFQNRRLVAKGAETTKHPSTNH